VRSLYGARSRPQRALPSRFRSRTAGDALPRPRARSRWAAARRHERASRAVSGARWPPFPRRTSRGPRPAGISTAPRRPATGWWTARLGRRLALRVQRKIEVFVLAQDGDLAPELGENDF
jgi:hypothetical protein